MTVAQPETEPEEIRLTIGDVAISDHWLVSPAGTVPVAGTQWSTQHMWSTRRYLPGWAVVLCILTWWIFLLGFLWLLVREERTTGSILVTVTRPKFMHTMSFPVLTPGDAQRTEAAVARARQLAIMAS